jgi:hypothetical protein
MKEWQDIMKEAQPLLNGARNTIEKEKEKERKRKRKRDDNNDGDKVVFLSSSKNKKCPAPETIN